MMPSGGPSTMTHDKFKRLPLDHVINEILDVVTDPDDAYCHVIDQYPTDKIQDYISTLIGLNWNY